jgi:hypothetical protein
MFLVTCRKVVAAAQRNVADVGDGKAHERRLTQDVLVGPDALDIADGARTEAGAGAVGDAEIHRHAQQGDVDSGFAAKLKSGRNGAQQGRGAGEGGDVCASL